MFEALTEKLNDVFKNLTGKGRLSEKDVDEGLRQVRLALLEADVNFRVARDLVGKIRERSIGSDVLESLTPGQQVIKIVNEELTAILTGGDHDLAQPSSQPGIVLMVGLQGKEPECLPSQSQHYGVRIVEPLMDVMGVEHSLIQEPGDEARIAPAIDKAYGESTPHVFLIGRSPS